MYSFLRFPCFICSCYHHAKKVSVLWVFIWLALNMRRVSRIKPVFSYLRIICAMCIVNVHVYPVKFKLICFPKNCWDRWDIMYRLCQNKKNCLAVNHENLKWGKCTMYKKEINLKINIKKSLPFPLWSDKCRHLPG